MNTRAKKKAGISYPANRWQFYPLVAHHRQCDGHVVADEGLNQSVNGLKAHESTGLAQRSGEYQGDPNDESTLCNNLSIDRADVARDAQSYCGRGFCAVDEF